MQKYANGVGAKSHYVFYNNNLYDLKALYGASCNPPVAPSAKTTRDSRKILKSLGFVCMSDEDQAKTEYIEGKRKWSEVQIITRNKGLVVEAKENYKTICKACGFDFSDFYGAIGVGFIECHHLNPISKITSKSPPVTVDQVTVLCANCHRMVHYGRKADDPLTVDQLKTHIAAARNSN